jgi:hypothetical protein
VQLLECGHLVVVHRDRQRAAHRIAGIARPFRGEPVDQQRVVTGGVGREAIVWIGSSGIGGGRQDARAGIGRTARMSLVNQQGLRAGLDQMVGGRQADHAAADHDRIEARHRLSPAPCRPG